MINYLELVLELVNKSLCIPARFFHVLCTHYPTGLVCLLFNGLIVIDVLRRQGLVLLGRCVLTFCVTVFSVLREHLGDLVDFSNLLLKLLYFFCNGLGVSACCFFPLLHRVTRFSCPWASSLSLA